MGRPDQGERRDHRMKERLQQFRMGTAVGATLGVLAAVSGLCVFALQSRNQAIRSLEDGMFATGSMVLLASGLVPNGDDANAQTRRLLIIQGCDLIDKLGVGSGRDPQIGELVTCRLERAASREQLGEQAQARAQYEDAIALATERYARTPRADAAARLLQARQAYAEHLFRQKDNAAAEAEYGRLRDDARRLGGALRDRAELVRAEGEALARLGDLLLIRGDRVQAAASFDQAADAVSREIGIEGERTSRQTVARLALLYRRAGEQHMQSDDPDGAMERFNRSLEARRLIAADRIEPSFDQEDAVTQALIFVLERLRGNSAAAEKASAEALAAIERVLSAASSAPNLKQRSAGLKSWIEQQIAGK
jgi:tetratricopeptide (TPR) repeat protein